MTVIQPRAAHEPTASARYGRLTYSSLDAGGVGGWQVKQKVGLG